VKLTTHIHLVTRSRMHGVISPLPEYAFMAWYWLERNHRDKFKSAFIFLFRTAFVNPWFTLEALSSLQLEDLFNTSSHSGQDVICSQDTRMFLPHLLPYHLAYTNIVTIFHGWTSCLNLLPPAHNLERSYSFQHYSIYEGRLQSSWTHLITPSRDFVEVRWRSIFRSTSLAKRCTSYNAPPASRKRAADRWSLRNFLPRSSPFMVGKAQKSRGARSELNSVFGL
jgi:hypothetical protein